MLLENQSFRWGGIGREFEKTAKEWKEDCKGLYPSGMTPYDRCFVCKKEPPQDQPLYAGFFAIDSEHFVIKIMCRECAYRISQKVIEPVNEEQEKSHDE